MKSVGEGFSFSFLFSHETKKPFLKCLNEFDKAPIAFMQRSFTGCRSCEKKCACVCACVRACVRACVCVRAVLQKQTAVFFCIV